MIQQIAPYIPLVHLRHGVHGSRGHVCSFPQEIEEICKILPRKKVKALKVIKSFNTKEKETREITFMVRRNVVLQALVWLKNNNRVYKDITIDENNMDWMGRRHFTVGCVRHCAGPAANPQTRQWRRQRRPACRHSHGNSTSTCVYANIRWSGSWPCSACFILCGPAP